MTVICCNQSKPCLFHWEGCLREVGVILDDQREWLVVDSECGHVRVESLCGHELVGVWVWGLYMIEL